MNELYSGETRPLLRTPASSHCMAVLPQETEAFSLHTPPQPRRTSLTVLRAGPQFTAVPGVRGQVLLGWRGQGAVYPSSCLCVETAHRRGATRRLSPEGPEQLFVGQLHVLEEL